MVSLKDKLKELTQKYNKAAKINPEAALRMVKVQEAASKAGKEAQDEKA